MGEAMPRNTSSHTDLLPASSGSRYSGLRPSLQPCLAIILTSIGLPPHPHRNRCHGLLCLLLPLSSRPQTPASPLLVHFSLLAHFEFLSSPFLQFVVAESVPVNIKRETMSLQTTALPTFALVWP